MSTSEKHLLVELMPSLDLPTVNTIGALLLWQAAYAPAHEHTHHPASHSLKRRRALFPAWQALSIGATAFRVRLPALERVLYALLAA